MIALLTLFIALCIVGLVLWGVGQIPGIPNIVKIVIYIVVGVVLLLWLLSYVQSGNFGALVP